MKIETAFDNDDSNTGNPFNKCVPVAKCGPISCYSCESRNDCMFCCNIILLLVALFIGVIGPLVRLLIAFNVIGCYRPELYLGHQRHH
jgi:hypothetical protein